VKLIWLLVAAEEKHILGTVSVWARHLKALSLRSFAEMFCEKLNLLS